MVNFRTVHGTDMTPWKKIPCLHGICYPHHHLHFNGRFPCTPPLASSVSRTSADKWHGLLSVRRSSHHPTNSVKALKKTHSTDPTHNWCQKKSSSGLYGARGDIRGRHTIQLGATPSGLISDPPPSSPVFTPNVLPATTLTIYPGLGQAPNMLACILRGLVHTQWLGAMENHSGLNLSSPTNRLRKGMGVAPFTLLFDVNIQRIDTRSPQNLHNCFLH